MLKLKQRQIENSSWACPEGMHPILHRLLCQRGVASDEEARRFMRPGREMLRDPFLLNDMQKAVDIIRDAIAKGEKICVYGDYDVDGVCASAILTLYLKELGADCGVYLPSRHTEGYGLNADAVDFISQSYSLLITVDCGITAFELVDRAKRKGMRVIVTDHHRPDEILPDCPTINPLLNGYPFGYLCGAGVAFQLVTALAGRDKAMDYIDLAALATIADIVPLRDENRAIAAIGLKKINISARPGIRALIAVSGLEGRQLSAGNIAFQLTPRLNASGRLGDAKRAYDLLTSSDILLCEALAEELDSENSRRKELENQALDDAEKQLIGYDFASKPAIIVKGDSWNPGVIGLAASRLTEKYHCPTVALTLDGDYYTGSCRSIEGVDIHEALKHVSHLLERFGGHKMAAGLKLSKVNLDEFSFELNRYMLENTDRSLWIPFQEYDAEINGSELSIDLVKQIDALSPTGCQNPEAVFLARCEMDEVYAVGKEKEHLKANAVTRDGTRLGGIWFRHGQDAPYIKGKANMLFAPDINTFMGITNVQALIKQIIPSSESLSDDRKPDASIRLIMALAEKFDSGANKPPVTLGEIERAYKGGIHANLIIAADAESANIALKAIGESADVCIGKYPSDKRGFNAVCLCPEGEIPTFYKNVYYAGVPQCLCSEGARILGIPASPLFSSLPDKDGLREIYKIMRGASVQNRRFDSKSEAILSLAHTSAMSPICFALGACTLIHAGLCGFEAANGKLRLTYSNEKRDPTQDELYAALKRL